MALCFEEGHAKQPNIVLLVADDLGYGELGCQGNTQIPTPHIDSFAADGVRFTNGYVSAAYCSASRAGLMTGRYQTRFGYEFNPIGAQNEHPLAGLPRSEQTLAKTLHNAGYATGLIGKWHLGGHANFHPYRHGFDEFFGFTHEGHYFVPPPYHGVTTMLRRRSLPGGEQGRWTGPGGRLILSTHMGYDEPAYDANNPIVRGGQPVPEKSYLTDALTREAVDFIERNKSRPFFLYLAYNAVHSPLQGADVYMQRFVHIEDIHRRIFAAMLSNLDDSVGAVLGKLSDEQLDDDTVVIFLSDNGGPTRELTSSNAPLRGEKGTVYEGGIRVPFLIRWPGKIKAGNIYDNPVISLDIFSTCTNLVGTTNQKNKQLDGVDLLPYLTGENKHRPHDLLYWRMGKKTAIRSGDWKLLKNSNSTASDWELYNLANDVSEQHDLAATMPNKVIDFEAKWNQMDKQMTDSLVIPKVR